MCGPTHGGESLSFVSHCPFAICAKHRTRESRCLFSLRQIQAASNALWGHLSRVVDGSQREAICLHFGRSHVPDDLKQTACSTSLKIGGKTYLLFSPSLGGTHRTSACASWRAGDAMRGAHTHFQVQIWQTCFPRMPGQGGTRHLHLPTCHSANPKRPNLGRHCGGVTSAARGRAHVSRHWLTLQPATFVRPSSLR